MRLGQLARKLDVRPNEIIEFLAKHNIFVDNSTNAKLGEDQVALTVQHFSPTTSATETVDQVQLTAAHDEINTTILQVAESDVPLEVANNETLSEQNEVIKAPKVELSGLKVLGKIDLPEIKKKESDQPQQTEESDTPNDPKKEKRHHETKRHQRPRKNPIALQREHEALETKKKREEEYRLQKERRTQNYLRKVKAHQPTKAARVIREGTEELSAAQLEEPPKTWWGKFVKWLTT